MQKRSNKQIPAVFVEVPIGQNAMDPHLCLSSLDVYNVTQLHYHKVLEIGYCVAGEGDCYVEEEQQHFRPGDVQVIFPFQPHLSKNSGRESGKWYWLNIDPVEMATILGWGRLETVARWMGKEITAYGIFDAERHGLIVDLVRQMIDEATHIQRPYVAEKIFSMLTTLLIELVRMSPDEGAPPMRVPKNFDLLENAIAYAQREMRLGHKPAVTAMAKECGMSESSFRRMFKEIIGLSPYRYLNDAAMRRAQLLLLSTDKSVIEIASESGFEDVSGFNRGFLSYCGMSPSAFRKAGIAGTFEAPQQ